MFLTVCPIYKSISGKSFCLIVQFIISVIGLERSTRHNNNGATGSIDANWPTSSNVVRNCSRLATLRTNGQRECWQLYSLFYIVYVKLKTVEAYHTLLVSSPFALFSFSCFSYFLIFQHFIAPEAYESCLLWPSVSLYF